MTILAIDPGPKQSAFVVWDGKRIINAGIITNEQIFDLIAFSYYEIFVIEQVKGYCQRAGNEIFETAFEAGRFYQSALVIQNIQRNVRLQLKAVLKTGRKEYLKYFKCKNDSDIMNEMIKRFGKNSTKNNPNFVYGKFKIVYDIWQALGLAIYTYEKMEGMCKIF